MSTIGGALISVNVDDSKLKGVLNLLISRAQNLQPAFAIIGKILRDSVRENFIAGGRPEKWTPLKDSTLLNLITKRKDGKIRLNKKGGLYKKDINRVADKKILIESRQLMRSINYRESKDNVEIGTNVDYAATHQFGDAQKRIPARPYLMIQNEDVVLISETLKDYLDEGL
jgi:phage virion morphogenesis protein